MACKEFYGYTVYDDGRIFSNKTGKFFKFDCYGSYSKVTLSIDKKPARYSVHRLIAYLFCNPPENNRRTREKGINDISQSNSTRWKDENFRKNTAKNISKGQIKSGCFAGKNNPRYRFEIIDAEGKEYMMSDLVNLTGKSLTWVYNHIRKFLNGENVSEFKNCGMVSIKDLKSKVNRLSKAEKQVE